MPTPKPRQRRRLSLALQGGGSFGAFTWGVLDRLLDEEDLSLDVVSGASAGAVNAVLLASGLASGGRPEAQRVLAAFWESASDQAPKQQPGVAADLTTRVLSPYQVNPFNLNPLRSLLAEMIDFEAMLAHPRLRLLVAATRVRDGKLRIFRERGLTLDAVLVSACLPLVHHAVEIDGEAYWDGGYSANPPLVPLIRASRARKALLVKIIPNARGRTHHLTRNREADGANHIQRRAAARLGRCGPDEEAVAERRSALGAHKQTRCLRATSDRSRGGVPITRRRKRVEPRLDIPHRAS
jgi:NTE family protein